MTNEEFIEKLKKEYQAVYERHPRIIIGWKDTELGHYYDIYIDQKFKRSVRTLREMQDYCNPIVNKKEIKC